MFKNRIYIPLSKILDNYSIETLFHKNNLIFKGHNKIISYLLAGDEGFPEEEAVIHYDQLRRSPEKIAAIVLSKLNANTTIYARNCVVGKVENKQAKEFLDKYHLMNSTRSASNLGLFYKSELVALATFSKGRKMNRLKEDQRSFELIRFCCKPEITVTGGLTRLIKNFCTEKKAGDIMTYVDKQLSDGKSFMKSGFKKHSETEPNYFLINRASLERMPAKQGQEFDNEKFYMSRNAGNIKLVYTPPLAKTKPVVLMATAENEKI